MKQLTIDIKCEKLFPFQFQVVGYGVLIGSIAGFQESWILGTILLIIGLFIVSSYNGTEINPKEKTFRDYNSYFFIKTGAFKKYKGIEKIFINSSRVSQKMYTAHTLDSSTFTNTEYNAYLKFDHGEKIFLLSSKDKDAVFRKLLPVADQLSIDVIDQTNIV